MTKKNQWAPNAVRKIKMTFFTIILLVFSIATIAQTTYYIDPSYTGSTQNGSMSNPYKSWTSVTLSNGNTYLQKRGTTYTSSSHINVNNKNSIIIGAYGSGKMPLFSYTGSGSAFRITNSNKCTVQDFEVNGNGKAHSLVYVFGSSSNYTNDNKVQNCNLHNAHNSNNAGFGVFGFYNNNLKLLNIEIHNIAIDGMFLQDIYNVEIGHCNIYDINRRYFQNSNEGSSSGDGIQLCGYYDGFHIHHTTIDRTNGALNKYSLILNSAPGKSDNATGILEYNTFINSAALYSAVFIERGNGVIVRYNIFKGASRGIRLGGKYTKNNLIHNNIFYNSTFGVVIGYTYGSSGGPCTGTKVYNNVFYNTGRHISVDQTSVEARNNIHHRTNNTDVAIHNYGGSSWTLSNNCYSTAAAAGTPGTGSNAIIGNPLFVDAANYNFLLKTGSPCIDAGKNVGIQHDFDATPIPQNGIPDIGAFEYKNGSSSNLPPVIGNQTFSVSQTATNGTLVGTVVASDPNQGQTLTYTITSGNTNGAFALNQTNGKLTVAKASALNGNSFNLIVRVTDNGTPKLWTQTTVTINITAAANQPPVINRQYFTINQNAANGTLVGTVVASDPDQGQTLTYTISSGNKDGAFAINQSNGKLTVANANALSGDPINLVVRVTDNGTPALWAHATVIISFTISNLPPVIGNQTFSVSQTATNGALVGTIAASDPNQGQTLTYTITSGNTNGAFALNQTNGKLTVAKASALNGNSFNLIVRVTDNGTPVLWAQATVTVNITATANQPPVINRQYFTINQNAANGTLVGTVVASDPDQGQTLIYTITSGNRNGAFSINQSNAKLTVANSNALSGDPIRLVVRATDNGTPSLWAHATVNIDFATPNQAPIIENQNFTVSQDATNGTLAGIVVASDPDEGQSLIYTITDGNTDGAFALNQSNGKLTVRNKNALNDDPFNLTVRAAKNSTPSLWAQATVIIECATPNQSPVINRQYFTITQIPVNGTFVGTVVASDPDQGQTLTYTITSGNREGAFSIDQSNAKLTVANANAMNGDPFRLVVRATDNGTPSLWAHATVNIDFATTPNQSPVINRQYFTISQIPVKGTFVGTVVASDPDQGQTLTYTITSGNREGAFSIDQSNAKLTVANANAMNGDPFRLVVRATDNGTPSLWAHATVNITFSTTKQSTAMNTIEPEAYSINEDTERGHIVCEFVTPDNSGERVEFYLLGGNTNDAFSLEANSGKLSVNNSQALDFETNPVFNLKIKAINNLGASIEQIIPIYLIEANEAPIALEQTFNTDGSQNARTEVTVYPNPSTNGIFHVKCAEFKSQEGTLTVLSLTGSVILQNNITGNNETLINLEAMPKGVYLLRIVDGKDIYTQKLIRQ